MLSKVLPVFPGWVLLPLIFIGQLSVSHAQSTDVAASVQCLETDDDISILIGDRDLLTYKKTVTQAPDGIDPRYERSGYIHPLQTPSGRIVTGDYAPDHAHQHALFSAWTSTTYDGQHVDFWNQLKGSGGVSFAGQSSLHNTDDFAEFTVKQKHQALKLGDKPITILIETWTVRANKTDNPVDQGYFVFDIHVSQTNVSEKPLTIDKYHYGGMAFRGSNQWFRQEGFQALKKLKPNAAGVVNYPSMKVTRHQFLTSEGKRRLEGNHSRPHWVDLSGLTDGEPAGVTVMSHPSNFRHPQPVRLHPSKPYFVFSPCVLGEFNIEPGETYQARYRYIVHDGAPNTATLNQLYSQFAKQPSQRD